MKKLLLILLLIAIPFQFSWAAAAVYCQHEQAPSGHFGHHSHQHQAGADKDDASKPLKKYHGDCEYCHLFSHASFISSVAEQPRDTAQDHLLPTARDYLSHIPAPPKRPNWQRRA